MNYGPHCIHIVCFTHTNNIRLPHVYDHPHIHTHNRTYITTHLHIHTHTHTHTTAHTHAYNRTHAHTEHLAAHLHRVASKPVLLAGYKAWKHSHQCWGERPGHIIDECTVCEYLHAHRHLQQTTDVRKVWWTDMCTDPRVYYAHNMKYDSV